MEYHRTKDLMHVKHLVGHKCVDATTLYVQIEKTLFKEPNDEFHVKVAREPEEIKALLEVGYEWVGEKDGLVYLRKRK